MKTDEETEVGNGVFVDKVLTGLTTPHYGQQANQVDGLTPDAITLDEITDWQPILKPTVYIVGFAPSWTQTPWDDPQAERWGLNALHKVAADKPFDRWYQLHDIDKFHTNDLEEHVGFLAAFDGPVYLWKEHMERWAEFIPNAVAYPKKEITDTFGTYFTNSISWMIAHALLEAGPLPKIGEPMTAPLHTKIGVYGVDMAVDSEYSHQRPSCEYFLGIAEGRGIKLILPPTSDLLKSPYLYGAEDGDFYRQKLEARDKELAAQFAQYEQQVSQQQAAMHQIIGARDQIKYDLRTWTHPSQRKEA